MTWNVWGESRFLMLRPWDGKTQSFMDLEVSSALQTLAKELKLRNQQMQRHNDQNFGIIILGMIRFK